MINISGKDLYFVVRQIVSQSFCQQYGDAVCFFSGCAGRYPDSDFIAGLLVARDGFENGFELCKCFLITEECRYGNQDISA